MFWKLFALLRLVNVCRAGAAYCWHRKETSIPENDQSMQLYLWSPKLNKIRHPPTKPAHFLTHLVQMCRVYRRVYTCGHFKTSTTYCTKRRYRDRDPCNPPKIDDASSTGVYCNWDGCDNTASLLRDKNPKGKPKVSSNFSHLSATDENRMRIRTMSPNSYWTMTWKERKSCHRLLV